MEQEIHFCTTTDGVRIAYATAGMGTPLVKSANWLNHLEFDWRSPIWRHLLEEFARDHLLVRYDERGNGLSDWNVERPRSHSLSWAGDRTIRHSGKCGQRSMCRTRLLSRCNGSTTYSAFPHRLRMPSGSVRHSARLTC